MKRLMKISSLAGLSGPPAGVLMLLFASLAFLSFTGVAQTCAPPPAGLLGWWPGEGTGQDVVGANNGTATSNVTFTSGVVGQGFSFDGNPGAVVLSNSAAYHLQDFSIEAWLKRASVSIASSSPGGGEIFGFGYGGYCLGMGDDGSLFLTRVGIDNVTLATGITDTSFHHVVVTKSGTTVVFHIDGQGFPMPPYQTTYSFSAPPAIGARGDNLLNSFLGVIDEVALYNRPLAASEVTSLYNAGSAGKCAGPMAPSITLDPSSRVVIAGTNVAFTVLAAGSSPVSFQWQLRGTNLAGATRYVLNLPNVQLANTGTYQAVITNAFGMVTSAVATLSIASPPVINDQPQNTSVLAGGTAVFLVGVSGSPPFDFQWRLNGTNLAAANNYSLVITNVQAVDTGSYTVVITNSLAARFV